MRDTWKDAKEAPSLRASKKKINGAVFLARRKRRQTTRATAKRSTTMTCQTSILALCLFLSRRLLFSSAFSPISRDAAHRRHSFATVVRSNKGPDDFFSLYDDEELWNILSIHRKLMDDGQSTSAEQTAASTSPPGDESNMSIHESFLKSQGEETMLSLLDLHESLKNGETDKAIEPREQLLDLTTSNNKRTTDGETTIPPSLHDLVQEAVGAVDTLADRNGVNDGTSVLESVELDDAMLKRIQNIRAIASDVDGTLLTSQQTIHPRSRQAVLRALKSPKHFFLATGKSRKGALNSLGVEMTTLLQNVPGVFLQGLYCIDGDGKVIYEKKLTNAAIQAGTRYVCLIIASNLIFYAHNIVCFLLYSLIAVEELAKECDVSLVAYDGDNLYSTGMTDSVRELSERYGEPTVVELDTLLSEYENGFHKILLVDPDVKKLTTFVRSKLDALAEANDASVTQAVPTMLEWLPPNCSKAIGVSKLCDAMGIDPSAELLAIGDAENDVGMLEMASIGVAVGNASPIAQEAADFLLEETNNEGGAGVAVETFGLAEID